MSTLLSQLKSIQTCTDASGLFLEIVGSAFQYMEANGDLTVIEAIELGYRDWIK